MKKSILLATSAFLAAGLVAVDAKAANVEVYGQVNKGVVYDVDSHAVGVVDNDYSSTRFGLRGSKAINHGLTASFLVEGEVQGTASNGFEIGANDRVVEGASAGWTERHTRVGVAGNWGALFVGKTSSATDGVTEIDLAPAGDVSGSGQDRISLAAPAGSPRQVDNFDGMALDHDADRLNVVRFDSPIFNGVQARVAYAPSGAYDAALYFNGKVAGLETAAGIGYVYVESDTNFGDVRDQISGSVSMRHDSGLALTLAGGLRDGVNGAVDGRFGYAKVGYAWGAYGVAAEYGSYTDVEGVGGNGATVIGVAGQYDLGNGVSTAAYYRNFDLTNGQSDADLVGVNLRVKF